MRELLPTLDEWAALDPHLAIATVVGTAGSTPRPTGARLLVDRDGRMAGSVSGGCLEAAVIGEAQATLAGEQPPRLLHYGISDEMGWEVGLACGGTVDIFVETVQWDGSDPVLAAVRQAIERDRAVALLTVVGGDDAGARAATRGDGTLVGTLGSAALDSAVVPLVERRLRSGLAGTDEVAGVAVFVDPIVASPHLAIVGAVHIAIALSTMARAAGYRVTVIDPRGAFLTEERLPDADLVAQWPDDALPSLDLGPRDAAVCLAHDPKFEDPALSVLLRSPVGYVGAIGSRTTHGKRVARLHEAGFTDEEIARIHSPVGLDIGAATAEEIAVSILAEVIATRRGRTGGALSASGTATMPATVA
ncbi:MAG TPA: XdhC/CoxI family protein [Candidatus Dormibacteraeota bacterium]|jgi:xanthine dehydrogenase accessory factor|nr:XdhC/CoxI family protein [Candidatus Dormibacteraeota bacterium]